MAGAGFLTGRPGLSGATAKTWGLRLLAPSAAALSMSLTAGCFEFGTCGAPCDAAGNGGQSASAGSTTSSAGGAAAGSGGQSGSGGSPASSSGGSPTSSSGGTAGCAGSCAKALGEACSTAEECESGHCTEGVCCDKACSGVCRSCKRFSQAGQCVSVPNGVQITGGCDGDQVCDGTGACVALPGGKKPVGGPCNVDGDCYLLTNCNDYICNLPLDSRCAPEKQWLCVLDYCHQHICSQCDVPSDCTPLSGADSKCLPNGFGFNYCTQPAGTPCKMPSTCSSGNCVSGKCK